MKYSKLKFGLMITIAVVTLASCSQRNEQVVEATETSFGKPSKEQLKTLIGTHFLIDELHSYVGFKIKYFGFSPVRGRFGDFNGTVFYDPEDLKTLSVTLIIDVSSINTGVERRDNDLLTEGAGWFNVKYYRHIKFTSTGVSNITEDSFDLHGEIEMNGHTKTLVIPFSSPTAMSKDWSGNDQVDYSGRFSLNRTDFGIEGDDFWSQVMENGLTQLSDDVEIELDIHTQRADYQYRYENEDSTNIRVIIPTLVREQGLEQALIELQSYKDQADSPVSAGAMSTIGYTLLEWGLADDAYAIFRQRQEWYPDRLTAYDQLAIAKLSSGQIDEARALFMESMEKDTMKSRAMEYLKLIDGLRN